MPWDTKGEAETKLATKLETVLWAVPATDATVAGGLAAEPEGRCYRQLCKPGWQPSAVDLPVARTAPYADLAHGSAVALRS